MGDLVVIDPDGDVVLVCGEGGQQKRLRVHSALLTRASPVFKALLSPRFREGVELSASGAVEVACPEDDGESMVIVCFVVHHQTSKAKAPPGLHKLLKIARLCDKYNLTELMEPLAQCWLSDELDLANTRVMYSTDPEDIAAQVLNDEARESILAASHYFGLESLFKKVAKDIVMKGGSRVKKENSQVMRLGDSILSEVLDALHSERQKNLEAVIVHLEDYATAALDMRDGNENTVCALNCCYAEKCLWTILTDLRWKGLWPVNALLKCSLESNTRQMQEVDLDDQSIAGYQCGYTCVAQGAPDFSWMIDNLHDVAAQMDSKVMQLCYKCVREDRVVELGSCGGH